MRVSVIGLGRAGLPLSAVIADSGIEVVGVDLDAAKVGIINSGGNPLPEEPGLGRLIKKHGGRRLKATCDYSQVRDCDVHVVVVPLFLDESHEPDYALLKSSFRELSKNMRKGSLVVLETTVPPGTTEGLVKRILDKSGVDYLLAYSPERIMTGYSLSRYRDFPKPVGGVDKKSTEAAYSFYRRFCTKVIKVNDCRTAELVKVAEGVYRDVNIALANELLKVSEELGVDYYGMREAANHLYCHLHMPGLVGGHCIPVYPWFLIKKRKVPLIKTARQINDSMVDYVVGKIVERLGGRIRGKKVGLVGLSYRRGVREAKFTLAHGLIKALKKRGIQVYGQDPVFTDDEIKKIFRVRPFKRRNQVDVVVETFDGITVK